MMPSSPKPSAVEAASEFCAELSRRYAEKLQEKTKPYTWASNYASGLGDVCLRRIVLHRTEGDKAKPMTAEGAGYVTVGSMLEDPVLDYLKALGFKMIMNQVRLPANDYRVGARIDRAVVWNGCQFPADLKTTSPWVFDSISDATSVKEHISQYVRRYYSQITLYNLLSDSEVGVLIFFDKQGGRVKAVAVPVDMEHGQWLLDRAAQVNQHVEKRTLPDYLADPVECRRCVFFGRVCDPPLNWGPGATPRPDLEPLAKTRDENLEAHKAYERADKKIKDELRGQELTLMGGYVARGHWQSRKKLEIPDAAKKQFEHVDAHGAWVLEIEKASE